MNNYLEVLEMIYAPKFPLRFKEKKVFENVANTKELVKFHMTNLLLTNPFIIRTTYPVNANHPNIGNNTQSIFKRPLGRLNE